MCIDVTVISPFTRHGPDSNALSTAVARKNEKHRGTGYRPSNFAKKNPLSTWAKPLVDEQASKAQTPSFKC